MSDMKAMMARHARVGRVEWIGLRPERRAALLEVSEATVTDAGLEGDHGRAGRRAVTLIQAEHLPVIATLSGHEVLPGMLRRNIVVSGINIAALRKGQARIGGVLLEISGPCPPCSRMEEVLGAGGYSAVRGHGGMYARVLEPGRIALGDSVTRG